MISLFTISTTSIGFYEYCFMIYVRVNGCELPPKPDSKRRYLGGGGADGEGSVGGDIFFHTERWGPPAALSALHFLLGVFFLQQIFVSRSDERI
jgi:hypothetical protein